MRQSSHAPKTKTRASAHAHAQRRRVTAEAPVIPFAPFGEEQFLIQPPLPPMEARVAKTLPAGDGWIYEPKWDGFRGLVFRHRDTVVIQSKAGQPLYRYFPELIEAFRRLPQRSFVLDGEIVILREGRLHFDELLQRIHPASSRIAMLSRSTPASFVAFDLLAEGKQVYLERVLSERKNLLTSFFHDEDKAEIENTNGVSLMLSQMAKDRTEAERWLRHPGPAGFDGVVAKRADAPYLSGERSGMVKVKRIRSADCVVGGFRYASKGGEVGSLLLGLYNSEGLLDHVGFCSSFDHDFRRQLKQRLVPLIEPPGFTGKAPGGPSRWSTERSTEWNPLRPELVCEASYDHFSSGRFRHGTKFLRWRPEKSPRQCTFEQIL